MSDLELTEKLLLKIGGWEAMKRARGYWRDGKVLSSDWKPPLLKGVVQAGSTSYQSGLVIKSAIDVENLCRCKESRNWGVICAHSLAIGIHAIKGDFKLESQASPGGRPARPEDLQPSPPQRNPDKCLMRAAPLDADAEPLSIHVVLPPNFERAVAADKVMVYFEGAWGKSRQPLNTLPMEEPFLLNEGDLRLLDAIEELAEGETPGMLMLRVAQFADLLVELRDHPRITLGKDLDLRVIDAPYQTPLTASLKPNGVITLEAGQNTDNAIPLPGERMWLFGDNEFRPLDIPPTCAAAMNGPVVIPRDDVPRFLNVEWPELIAKCDLKADFSLQDFTIDALAPTFLLNLRGTLHKLEALLQCRYDRRVFTLGDGAPMTEFCLPDPDNPKRYTTRDPGGEFAALQRLQSAGFQGPNRKGRLELAGEPAILSFFARLFPRLQKDWDCELEGTLEPAVERIDRIEPEFQILSSGENWFDLKIDFKSGSGRRFSPADIQRLLLSGSGHTKLPNGRNAVLDTGSVEELNQVLLDCEPDQTDGGYRINERQAGYLAGTLSRMGFENVSAPQDWRQRAFSASGDTDLTPPPLGDLEDVLRPYQKHGVGWLNFLRSNRFGGILADEMGLGKTLQTLALLRAAATESRKEDRRPSLIVCPTSLVANWISEAARFTPELKSLKLHGTNRHTDFTRIPESDLVVTSYALARRDLKQYRRHEFDTVVLDEAQHIKNRQTQNAKAVKAVRARNRIVLTGTPMENSVLDLWSIFDFLMPGYLGSARDFRDRYEVPITRDKDAKTQDRLARRLRPFVLRRLKSEVAKDLPEKIEQVSYCALTPQQASVYEQVLTSSRQAIHQADEKQGAAKGRMVALQALLRLRQICCDLRLLNLPETNEDDASAKLDLFGELLEEAIDGGHRILVFSQFVSMLKLLRERLDAEDIPFCQLDGSTRNRQAVVDKFQQDASIPVFLISLKAGGTGLNLTGADTVVHFDPWWNPAVEDQATDRAHRIGQRNVVTSYKLIVRDTVEEKILSLQQRKRDIAKGMLGDESAFTESLSWEEIKGLFD